MPHEIITMVLTKLIQDYHREEKYDVTKIQICEIMRMDSIFRKDKVKKKNHCHKSAFLCKLAGRYKHLYVLMTLM